MSKKREKVCVVGAGLMGTGIGLAFALAGREVALVDRDQPSLQRASGDLDKLADALIEAGLQSDDASAEAREHISLTDNIENAATDAGFVVESVYEDADLKASIFRQLDAFCPPTLVLASNTSSFSASRLADGLRNPDRVVVANWWNPPHILPLVEVVGGPQTGQDALDETLRQLKAIGKEPVLLAKESKGYVGNRLQMALLREALTLVGEGVVSAADLDRIVVNGFGRRLAVGGPLKMFDLAGWQTIAAVAEEIFPTLDRRSEVPSILTEMLADGQFGAKEGRGFFAWDTERLDETQNEIATAFHAIDRIVRPSR